MRGYRLKTSNFCEFTGWPINYLITKSGTGKDEKPIAVNFMQRQELSYNMATRESEPRGLQKIMMN